MNPQLEHKKRLQGKVAVITGATGGIGEATAKLFLQEGANVMLVARSAEKLKDTCDRLGVDKGMAHFVADATDETATAAAIAATVKVFGGVDILFANAGTEGKSRPLEEQTLNDFEQVLRTNVVGVRWNRKFLPRILNPVRKGVEAVIPLRRYGTNEGVARVAVFLAGDESSCCTGGIHMIDGGYTAG